MVWNSFNAEIATNGKSTKKWNGNKVVIDSRLVEKGDIFVALKGKNTNGHEFVKQAIAQGASVAIVDKIPDKSFDLPLLVVEDTLKAINDLANYKRNISKAKFIALTGSVGKTTTKELLKYALEVHGNVFASRGNYNNHLGVPINIASMPLETDYAIIEMGMNGSGEISYLSKITKPHLAIITNIYPVHIAYFNSLKEIALAKAEIFEGLQPEGKIILNANNDQYSTLKEQAEKIKNSKVYTIGDSFPNNLLKFMYLKDNCLIEALVDNKKIKYHMQFIGKHIAENSIAALTTVNALGLNVEKSANNLINFQLLAGRGQIIHLKNITLIDESYNASPASVKSAINLLGSTKGTKLAVLADMFELGEDSIKYHEQLAIDVIDNKIDKVITFGQDMKYLFAKLPENIKLAHFDNLEDLLENFHNFLDGINIVLVKGSYGTKIHQLISKLKQKDKNVI